MDSSKRCALVTGGGAGLGRELSLLLHEREWSVAVLDRDEALLRAIPPGILGVRADVTDLEQTRGAIARIEAGLGRIDLVIANAGVGMPTPATCFRAEEIAGMVRVNLIGVANTFDAVLPGMIKRKSGHLAAISSLASYRGLPRLAGYSASKAGVNALMDSLRVELRPLGIRVTTVCPGWVRTAMTAGLHIPADQTMDTHAAAIRILDAIERGRRFHAFPRRAVWRVRLLRWLPRPISDWLLQRVLARRRRQRTQHAQPS